LTEDIKEDNQSSDLDSLSRHERRMLKHSNKESIKLQESQKTQGEKRSKNLKKFSMIAAVVIVIIGAISFGVMSYNNSAGPYDKFAKCLKDKGAIMYGATWCEYTAEQKAMFGKSFKYVNYQDFTKGPDISVTPTWVIDGKKYERAQSFERLASLSGCEIA